MLVAGKSVGTTVLVVDESIGTTVLVVNKSVGATVLVVDASVVLESDATDVIDVAVAGHAKSG